MPSTKDHQVISFKRTEKTYAELHDWMDEGTTERGLSHTSKNHVYSKELKDYIFNNFGGKEAVSEWLFHIALDHLDTSVLNDWNNLDIDTNLYKLGFQRDNVVHYSEDVLDHNEFKKEFPDDIEE